jgi:hypothetical protein
MSLERKLRTTSHDCGGKHTPELLLGDGTHVPHNPPVISKKITVTITK